MLKESCSPNLKSVRPRQTPAGAFLVAALCLTTLACHAATQTAQVAPATPAPPAAPADDATMAKPEEKTYSNTIKWTTASELDNFGFDVFRGDTAEGPFKRLNAKTIEGAGTSDEPHDYRFTDDTIDPYRAYYYYVESISMNGERELFTPIGRAKPKIAPKEEKPADGEESKDADSR